MEEKETIDSENSFIGDNLYIKGTDDTPEVVIDPVKGFIKFAGRSLPEDPKGFYTTVKEHMEKYIKNPQPGTRIVFMFEYFNTASSKIVMELIDMAKQIYDNDDSTIIEWHYLEDDDDMREAGEDFEEITEVKFEYFTYDN